MKGRFAELEVTLPGEWSGGNRAWYPKEEG